MNNSDSLKMTPSSGGQDFDFLFKLLIIGNSGVGKSCMLLRYSENNFTSNFFNTIGVDFKIKGIVLDGKNVKLQIWDTAGQDRFKTITTTYYRGAQGILVVYDITDRESFEGVKTWMGEIEKYAQENVIKVLIGNKSDMMDKRVVSLEEGQALAREYGVMFLETSAKNSQNIDQSFQTIARLVMEKTGGQVNEKEDFRGLRLGERRRSQTGEGLNQSGTVGKKKKNKNCC